MSLAYCGNTGGVGVGGWNGYRNKSNDSAKSFGMPIVPATPHYYRRELPQVSFLSRQTYFCCDKRHNSSFVVTKSMLVATNTLIFVAASILLSRQKTCFVGTNTCLSRLCRDNSKMVLAAAPANDTTRAFIN